MFLQCISGAPKKNSYFLHLKAHWKNAFRLSKQSQTQVIRKVRSITVPLFIWRSKYLQPVEHQWSQMSGSSCHYTALCICIAVMPSIFLSANLTHGFWNQPIPKLPLQQFIPLLSQDMTFRKYLDMAADPFFPPLNNLLYFSLIHYFSIDLRGQFYNLKRSFCQNAFFLTLLTFPLEHFFPVFFFLGIILVWNSTPKKGWLFIFFKKQVYSNKIPSENLCIQYVGNSDKYLSNG